MHTPYLTAPYRTVPNDYFDSGIFRHIALDLNMDSVCSRRVVDVQNCIENAMWRCLIYPLCKLLDTIAKPDTVRFARFNPGTEYGYVNTILDFLVLSFPNLNWQSQSFRSYLKLYYVTNVLYSIMPKDHVTKGFDLNFIFLRVFPFSSKPFLPCG